MKVVRLGEVEKVPVRIEGAERVVKQMPISSADGAPTFSFRVFTVGVGGQTPYHSHEAEHVNYVIAGLYIAARGRVALTSFLHALPRMIIYEGAPLVFSPLIALTYTQLGLGYVFMLALTFVAGSLVAYSLAFTNIRFERRVKELDSLYAYGHGLSASLDIDTIANAIHTRVAHVGDVSLVLAKEQGHCSSAHASQ